MTPTQADREAAATERERQYAALGHGLETLETPAAIRSGSRDWDETVQAFTRHRLAAEAAAFEKAAGVVKVHQAARLAAKHNALERGQKAEARDHESMAMEAGHILVSIQTFIRKLAGEKHD